MLLCRFCVIMMTVIKNEKRISLSILSGEIGGGSTEALICLGISFSVGL